MVRNSSLPSIPHSPGSGWRSAFLSPSTSRTYHPACCSPPTKSRAASRWPSSACNFQPSDRLFDDRQVDQRRRHAEEHRQPPDYVVGTGHLERPAAEPDAKEAADLMAEERKAEQHG